MWISRRHVGANRLHKGIRKGCDRCWSQIYQGVTPSQTLALVTQSTWLTHLQSSSILLVKSPPTSCTDEAPPDTGTYRKGKCYLRSVVPNSDICRSLCCGYRLMRVDRRNRVQDGSGRLECWNTLVIMEDMHSRDSCIKDPIFAFSLFTHHAFHLHFGAHFKSFNSFALKQLSWDPREWE